MRMLETTTELMLNCDFPNFGSATLTLNFVRYINLIWIKCRDERTNIIDFYLRIPGYFGSPLVVMENKTFPHFVTIKYSHVSSGGLELLSSVVFHSRLVGTYGTGIVKLLIINCKLYFDKIWQMSHTYPKVTEVMLFRYRISFLVNSCLDTEPSGRCIILWRNIRFRASFFEGSRLSPTMDYAISELVGTGNPWICLTALCWKHEIAGISAFVWTLWTLAIISFGGVYIAKAPPDMLNM